MVGSNCSPVLYICLIPGRGPQLWDILKKNFRKDESKLEDMRMERRPWIHIAKGSGIFIHKQTRVGHYIHLK